MALFVSFTAEWYVSSEAGKLKHKDENHFTKLIDILLAKENKCKVGRYKCKMYTFVVKISSSIHE